MNRGEPEEIFETVAHRREFLTLLADEPLDKASIVRRLDVSRSTVNRAISALESYGFVERVEGAYTTTTAGNLARRHLRETLSTIEGLRAAQSFLDRVGDLDPPPALFRDATVVTADENRHGPVRSLVELLANARTVRSAGAVFRNDVPTSVRERLLNDDELRMTLVMSPETIDRMRAYHGPELHAIVASDRHELRLANVHRRTTVAVVDTGSVEHAVVVCYDEAAEPIGLVQTTDPACLVWAREEIERAWTASTPVAAGVERP